MRPRSSRTACRNCGVCLDPDSHIVDADHDPQWRHWSRFQIRLPKIDAGALKLHISASTYGQLSLQQKKSIVRSSCYHHDRLSLSLPHHLKRHSQDRPTRRASSSLERVAALTICAVGQAARAHATAQISSPRWPQHGSSGPQQSPVINSVDHQQPLAPSRPPCAVWLLPSPALRNLRTLFATPILSHLSLGLRQRWTFLVSGLNLRLCLLCSTLLPVPSPQSAPPNLSLKMYAT